VGHDAVTVDDPNAFRCHVIASFVAARRANMGRHVLRRLISKKMLNWFQGKNANPKSATPMYSNPIGPDARPAEYATPYRTPYSNPIGPAVRPEEYTTPFRTPYSNPIGPQKRRDSKKKPRRPGTTVCKAIRMAKSCPKPGDIRGKRANRKFPATVYVMRRFLQNTKIPPSELKKAFPHGVSAAKRAQLLAYFRKHPRRCERLMKYGKRVCA